MSAHPPQITPVEGNQMVAVPTTSEAVVAAQTNVRAFWCMAKRAAADNTGEVYLNVGTATSDLSGDHWVMLDPGDYWEMPIPIEAKFDLNNLYVDAEIATDGIVWGYFPA